MLSTQIWPSQGFSATASRLDLNGVDQLRIRSARESSNGGGTVGGTANGTTYATTGNAARAITGATTYDITRGTASEKEAPLPARGHPVAFTYRSGRVSGPPPRAQP